MRQCPSCRSTYTDETLRYCLADGTALVEGDADEATMIRTAGNVAAQTEVLPRAVRVDIPEIDRSSAPVHSVGDPSPEKRNSILKAVVIAGVIGVLLIAALGVAGLIYYNSSVTPSPGTTKPPTPTATQDQTVELREQIANLEKRINEQKNADRTPLSTQATPIAQKLKTARVDSPGDGFLALRSLPNSETGERVLKIPHGATIEVGECGPVVRPVRRSGRWCRTSYNGATGWVFDAYLVYSSAKE
ncbi:MAG: SH3 domain-containing protein [Pyrinomonadaceae bacterium]